MPDISTILIFGVVVFLTFVGVLILGLCAAAGRQMPTPPQPTTRPTSSNRKSGRVRNYAGESSSSGGVGFAGLLTVLFIGLKLTGYVTWSWWWVLSPLWISAAVTVVVLALVFLWLAVFDR